LSTEIKHRINDFLRDSTRFNANDVLIHASIENKKLHFSNELCFNLNEFPSKILKESKKFKKETGVNTLSRSSGIVAFTFENKEVQTPIILHSLDYSIDKLSQKISLNVEEEEWFINPFLRNFIVHTLEKEVPDFEEIESFYDFLQSIGLVNISRGMQFIGNFHHHRFQIIKELEGLMEDEDLAPNVKTLLGESAKMNTVSFDLSSLRLLSSDVDHEKVFETLTTDNCVVQGPPGTGKSQVLTNVLANNLINEATTIVVSEKRVALEVLVKKLSSFQLDKLCFIATSDHLSHAFIQELKKTWDYFDAFEPIKQVVLNLSKQYQDHLQMSLDLLRQKELIGGISFSEFQSFSKEYPEWKKTNFSSQTPTLKNTLKYEKNIEVIYENKLENSIAFIQPDFLKSDLFLKVDVKVNKWLESIRKINKQVPFSTFEELRNVMKLAVNCQVFENEIYKNYAPILRVNSRPQKRFLSLRKKYLKLKKEVDFLNSNQSHWKQTPSKTEAIYLIDVFNSKGFFSLRKASRRWKELSNISVKNAVEILQEYLKEIEKRNQLSKITIDFCEININSPEIEVESIYRTITQFNTDQWTELDQIPMDVRLKLTNSHTELQSLFSDFRTYFSFDEGLNILSYLEDLSSKIESILPLKSKLDFLNTSFQILIKKSTSKKHFFEQVLKSNWVKFKEQFPAFSDFKMEQLKQKVDAVIQQEKIEALQLSREIENKVKSRFDEYALLLQTPAHKLSKKDKEKKVVLRRGKSILIKEFNKTRSHPSLRELYNSEARIWIELLKPIWLSNPTQLSKCFPLKKDLFDLAIFDEASQIPLQNALGTVQRSKQILIAGDEHQMGPTSYFKKGEDEVVDLLHQANYHFSKVKLKHHYRSSHPDLVAFSNKFFYENELNAFPSVKHSLPLQHHFISEGRFIDRKNCAEAKIIALQIEKLLQKSESIGVVAFSEEQLNCIWNKLSEKYKNKFQENLENNIGFFKSLENVQGDECGHLLISFGFGKNEDGEFFMRFGPMNKVSGRKRLNVLLTRAKESIHFYCSIKAADFKLTDNESVQLLQKWVSFSENYQLDEGFSFPFGLKPIVQGNKLFFKNIHNVISEAKELGTLQNVLEKRGWETVYT